MWSNFGKPLFVYLCLHRAQPIAEQSQSETHIKNVFYLGPQISPQLPGLSRGGGASILLNGHVILLFHDTAVTFKVEELLIFVSDTAAYRHAPERNITLLVPPRPHTSA
jgi:hypothetical protein